MKKRSVLSLHDFVFVKAVVFAIVALFFVSSFLVSVSSESDLFAGDMRSTSLWWNADWLYRRSVTVNHEMVEGNLSDFPVLVEMMLDVSKVQSGGEDVLFVADDGITRFAHEIESFDESSGALVAWVNVTNVSSVSNTVFDVYYGNPSCASQEEPSGVWNNGFDGVWHLAEDTGNIQDSTINDNEGVPEGDLTYGATGIINGALGFDGTDDAIDTGIYPDASSKTVEAWINFDMFPSGDLDMTMGCQDSQDHRLYLGYDEQAFFYGIGDTYASTDDLAGVSAGEWVYLVLTGDMTTAHFYVNGVVESITSYSQSGSSVDSFHIGSRTFQGNASNFIDGLIDEVRISSVVRSNEWIETSYNNQVSPSLFFSVGEELVYSENPIICNPGPVNGSVGIGFNPVLSVDVLDCQNESLTITFLSNASGTWQTIETFTNAGNGRYNCTQIGRAHV